MIVLKLKDIYTNQPAIENSNIVFRIYGDTIYAICPDNFLELYDLLNVTDFDFANRFISIFTDLKAEYNVSYSLHSLLDIFEQSFGVKLSSEQLFVIAYLCESAVAHDVNGDPHKLFEIDYKAFTFKIIVYLKDLDNVEFIYLVQNEDKPIIGCKLENIEKLCVKGEESINVFIYNNHFYFINNSLEASDEFMKKLQNAGFVNMNFDFKDELSPILAKLPLNIPIAIDSIRELINLRFIEMATETNNIYDGGLYLTDLEFIVALEILKDIKKGVSLDSNNNSLYAGIDAYKIFFDVNSMNYFIIVNVDVNDPYTKIG